MSFRTLEPSCGLDRREFLRAIRSGPVLVEDAGFWTDSKVDPVGLLRERYGQRRISQLRSLYGSVIQLAPSDRARYGPHAQHVVDDWRLAQYMDAAESGSFPLYLSNVALSDLPELAGRYRTPGPAALNLFGWSERARAPELFIGGDRSRYAVLHMDACGGSVWCSCLAGEKEWIVFPPEDSNKLLPFRQGDEGQLRCSLFDPWDSSVWKFFKVRDLKPFRVRLRAGAALFLPPNWWHITRNHGLTVTINERVWDWRSLPLIARYVWHNAWSAVLPGQRQPFVLY